MGDGLRWPMRYMTGAEPMRWLIARHSEQIGTAPTTQNPLRRDPGVGSNPTRPTEARNRSTYPVAEVEQS
jgi:hypothetical protein